MSGWSERDLDLVGAANGIIVAPDRADHTPGPAVPIWVVRVGEALYVRSYRGPSGGWYRRARGNGNGRIRSDGESLGSDFSEVAGTELRARIDEAYRVKYGRYGSSYVTPMASDSETTLQLEPVG
jgi:hypothetical protein